MSVPASSPPQAVQADAGRSADLSELLGHVYNCWDDERRTLSRQLHDNLGSSLTALTMHLGLLAQKLPPEPALLERAAHMKQLLHQIVESNREMQHRLWNDTLEFLGPRVALGELATEWGEIQQLAVRCSLPEEELACPRSHSVVLLRTLEEALNNVAVHAQASVVDIIVDDNEEQVTLTVRDDGVGLAGAAPFGSKFGLRMARERAAYLGGSLLLEGNGERGATLVVTLPKAAAAA